MSENNVNVVFELLNNEYSISCSVEKRDLLVKIVDRIKALIIENKQKYPRISKERLLIQSMINILAEQDNLHASNATHISNLEQYIDNIIVDVNSSLEVFDAKVDQKADSICNQ